MLIIDFKNLNLDQTQTFNQCFDEAKITNKFHYINKSLGGYWIEEGQNMTTATEKQIKMHEAIFAKHSKDLTSKNQSEALALLDYAKARIYHKLKNFSEAKKYYLSALGSVRNDIRFKSLCGIGLTIIRKQY